MSNPAIDVVKEDGVYKVLDTSERPDAIALEILDRIGAGDLNGAKVLLDWLRRAARTAPLSLDPDLSSSLRCLATGRASTASQAPCDSGHAVLRFRTCARFVDGGFRRRASQPKADYRPALTAFFGFVAAFIPLATSLAMGFIHGPFVMLFGFVGAVPGAACSWIAGRWSGG